MISNNGYENDLINVENQLRTMTLEPNLLKSGKYLVETVDNNQIICNSKVILRKAKTPINGTKSNNIQSLSQYTDINKVEELKNIWNEEPKCCDDAKGHTEDQIQNSKINRSFWSTFKKKNTVNTKKPPEIPKSSNKSKYDKMINDFEILENQWKNSTKRGDYISDDYHIDSDVDLDSSDSEDFFNYNLANPDFVFSEFNDCDLKTPSEMTKAFNESSSVKLIKEIEDWKIINLCQKRKTSLNQSDSGMAFKDIDNEKKRKMEGKIIDISEIKGIKIDKDWMRRSKETVLEKRYEMKRANWKFTNIPTFIADLKYTLSLISLIKERSARLSENV